MEKRVAAVPSRFWAAAERLAMLRAIYGERVPPPPAAALNDEREPWKREDAIRELVRGRMEVCGPVTTAALAQILELTPSEIDRALLALEAEGFRSQGQVQSGCERDRMVRSPPARPNPSAHNPPTCARRSKRSRWRTFKVSCSRGNEPAASHRVEGPEGVKAVLELLDGYEMPAAAWEPEVLALRVNNYTPAWLDQLCFTGRIGWCRLTSPQGANGSLATPVRSSPISIYARENLPHWLSLSASIAAAGVFARCGGCPRRPRERRGSLLW